MPAEPPRGPLADADAFERMFASPLLRVLDARGRADVRTAARVRRLLAGEIVFNVGEPADTLFVVADGGVTVEGRDTEERANASELFGRDALVPGARRSGRARASEAGVVVELPLASLRRALSRAGAAELLAREENAARRRAFHVLVRSTPFGRELHEPAFEQLSRAWHEETFASGRVLLEAGDDRDFCFVVVRGLVELAPAGAHAASGDWVGLEAVRASVHHVARATALSEVTALRVSGSLLRELRAKNQRAFALLEEQTTLRSERQRRMRELAGRGVTRHAFHEIGRLESASSLLALDLERCVRCGQCTSACAETHGTARFDREGSKIRLNVRGPGGELESRAAILPNACQHCADPACLPECPTGAITRDASGTVLVRAELCTGCGACQKACPYDAIRLETSDASGQGASGIAALVASKCDLCHGHSGPACVSACPTGAVARLSPKGDLVEVAGASVDRSACLRPAVSRSLPRDLLGWFVLPPLLAFARFGAEPHGAAFQFVTGVLALGLSLGLLAQGLVKRRPRVREWLQRRVFSGSARGLAPLVRFHAASGVVALAVVVAHAGLRVPHGAAGALTLVFYLVGGSGIAGAILYRALPARLTRLERHSAPAAGRARECDELWQRWFDGLSAQNDAVKELARRVLLPYATAPFGGFALVLSGRTLAAEAAKLERHVEQLLGGRKSERLRDVRALVETAVALRAFLARRWLEALLCRWLPCHVVLSAALFVLLVVHVVAVLS